MTAEDSPGRGDQIHSLPAMPKVESLEQLTELLREEPGQRNQYVDSRLPLAVISVLPQPRKTFKEIEELAGSIADSGLMEPLIIAGLNEDNAKKYLAVVNYLWRTNFTISDLQEFVEGDGKFFYILLDGERRFRALKLLFDSGCGKEHNGEICSGPGPEFHFPDGKVRITLGVNLSPREVLSRQAQANLHMEVPPHENAKFYYQYFLVLRQAEPKLTLVEFAREMGKNADTIKSALRFCELPTETQELVEKGYIPYGKAVEIARLREAALGNGVKEEELNLWFWQAQAMLKRETTLEFRKRVTQAINDLKLSQTMSSLFAEAQKTGKKTFTRRVVAPTMVMDVHAGTDYFKRVIALHREGWFGEGESPLLMFSLRSPAGLFLKHVSVLKEFLPILRAEKKKHKLSKGDLDDAKRIIEESHEVLEALVAILPEGGDDLDPLKGFSNQR